MTTSVKKLIPTMQAAAMSKVSQMTLSALRWRKDFPEPEVRGWYRLIDVEAWIADRRKGIPLPSGRILSAWVQTATLAGKLIDLRAVCEAARTTEATLRMWVRRGDFPKSTSRGYWLVADVENWAADRKKGKPMPASLTIPVAWRPEISGGSYSSHALLEITRLGANKIYDLMHRGDFPEQIKGHKGKWPKNAVDEWIAARKRGERLNASNRILSAWDNEYRETHPQPMNVALLNSQLADTYYATKMDSEMKAHWTENIFGWHAYFPEYLSKHGTQAELDEYNALMRLNRSPHAQIARPGTPLPQQADKQAKPKQHATCPDDSNDEFIENPKGDPNSPEYDPEFGLEQPGESDDEDYGLDDI